MPFTFSEFSHRGLAISALCTHSCTCSHALNSKANALYLVDAVIVCTALKQTSTSMYPSWKSAACAPSNDARNSYGRRNVSGPSAAGTSTSQPTRFIVSPMLCVESTMRTQFSTGLYHS
eukprot:18739-Heterococcus_DN1.PRE.3